MYHPKLTDTETIKAAIKIINNNINGCGYTFKEDTDGRMNSIAYANSCEGENSLIILASTDLSYYHSLEIVFYDVSYTNILPQSSWWDYWTKDQIELSAEIADEFEFRFNVEPQTGKQNIVKAKAISYLFQSVNNFR